MAVATALAGALFFGINAAPAIASDGNAPLAEDIAAGELLESIAPVDDDAALPVAPAVEGAPAGGAASEVAEESQSGISGGAEAAADAVADVISGAVERDIASVAIDTQPTTDAVREEPIEEREHPRPDAVTTVEQNLPTTPIDEIEVSLGGAAELAAASPDRDAEIGGDAEDPQVHTQYQKDSSQYQSDEISELNSWRWEWYLELDCDGIASSTSNEIGTSASDDWTWVWNWNWTCGLDGASEGAAGEMQQSFPTRTDPAERARDASQSDARSSSGQTTDPNPPWLWTWTFTFCGNTTTIVTPVAIDYSLRWIWEWTWAWACTTSLTDGEHDPGNGEGIGGAGDATPGSQGDATPGSQGDATPGSQGDADAVSPVPWVDEFVRFDEPIAGLTDQLLAYDPSTVFPLPPAAAPLTLDAPRPAQTAAAPATARPARSPSPTLTTGATAELEPRAAAVTPERPSARKAPRRDASPQRQRSHRPPLDTSPRGIAGAPASSGSAPAGTGAGSVAALTGFLVLAAPGLGRRIREARELSPRAPVRDRLERPG
jgi:hypothetical protein